MSGVAPPSNDSTSTDPTGLLTPYLGSYADTDSEGDTDASPFFLSATPIVGYDSNPQALHNARSSAFLGGDLSAGYAAQTTLFNGNPLRFAAEYDVTGAFDRGETKLADGIQQSATAAVQHTLFHDTLRLNVVARDQFTYQDGEAFLNSVDVAPSAELFVIPQGLGRAGVQLHQLPVLLPARPRAAGPRRQPAYVLDRRAPVPAAAAGGFARA